MQNIFRWIKRRAVAFFFAGFAGAVLLIVSGHKAVEATSTDEFCASCHDVHPHAITSWKRSTHYDNKRGVVVHCVECHLPPKGLPMFTQKVRTGVRDVYGSLFTDVTAINWEEKSRLASAVHHTFETSCVSCHENLFPIGLSDKGQQAHLYFDNHKDELNCLNCHIGVGHFSESTVHAENVDFGKAKSTGDTIFTEPAKIRSFDHFTEQIPETGIQFEMKAIPGGTFRMGSPESESLRDPDEGPQREVEVGSFFMAEQEVTWQSYMAFMSETGGEGRMSAEDLAEAAVDGITGPTPPWGAPDQGWGLGQRPAITMSYHAATVYCEWLSEKTGKTYRLPTEAEWEYAARGGTPGPYFFDGDPRKFTSEGFARKLFGTDTSVINSFAVYKENSRGQTALPDEVQPNPYGLKNMYGNVAEFCSDIYTPSYGASEANTDDNAEHVVRGGSYQSDARDLRSAARDYTRSTAWLKTDPQMPKSIWWYSDQAFVGFRVVCEADTSVDN